MFTKTSNFLECAVQQEENRNQEQKHSAGIERLSILLFGYRNKTSTTIFVRDKIKPLLKYVFEVN